MKDAILLTGGSGSRLLPLTRVHSKHLVYLAGKPIIDYPLTTLQGLGCENVSIVVGSSFSGQIMDYLQDGSRYGMNFNYIYQEKPVGIAQAINLCKRFVQDRFVVMLGDNYFEKPVQFKPNVAQIVLHKHSDLTRFGVASIKNGNVIRIEEKPKVLDCNTDNYAITGCYLFDQRYFEFFQSMKPSSRGEFEITEIIQKYLDNYDLDFTFTTGAWSDLGTHSSLQSVQNHIYKEHLNEV
jgi:glucose-1-phosphate thymidylyltransferase